MKLHNVPLYGMCILIVGLALTYTISVSLGHVYYWFPLISDTCAEPPESGIFGFILNVVSVMLLVAMYIRYCQINCLNKAMLKLDLSPFWNLASLVFGLFTCLGLNMVANFSEVFMGDLHFVGSIICFTFGSLYFMMQTKITYHFISLKSEFAVSKFLFMARFFICILIITFYSLLLGFQKRALSEYKGKKINYWTPKDGGIEYRLIATFSEWITVISIALYIMTFTLELKKFDCVINVGIKST